MELLICPLRLCGHVYMAWKRAVGLWLVSSSITGHCVSSWNRPVHIHHLCCHDSPTRQERSEPLGLGLSHKSKHSQLLILYCIIHGHDKLIYRRATIWQALVYVLFDSNCSCSIHFSLNVATQFHHRAVAQYFQNTSGGQSVLILHSVVALW